MSENKDSLLYISILNQVFKNSLDKVHLQNTLLPFSEYLESVDNFEAFSLVKHITGNNELAFFVQWFLDTQTVIHSQTGLIDKNKKFLISRVNPDLKGLPDLYSKIHDEVRYKMIPNQTSFANFVSRESIDFLTRKHPATSRYLGPEYLSKIQDALSFNDSAIYKEIPNLTQKLDSLGYGLSFLRVGLPLLVSFTYQVSQPGSLISSKGVKWIVIEEICKNLAILHATQNPQNILPFVYQLKLDGIGLYKFHQSNNNSQIAESLLDEEIQEELNLIRSRLRQTVVQKLENLVFPKEYIALMHSVLEWVGE